MCIRRLDLRRITIFDDTLAAIAASPCAAGLLTFRGRGDGLSDSSLPYWSAFLNLEELRLGLCPALGLPTFMTLVEMKRLAVLSCYNMSDHINTMIETFLAPYVLPDLRSLVIGGTTDGDWGPVLLEALKKRLGMHKFEKLVIRSGFSASSFETSLELFRCCPNLRKGPSPTAHTFGLAGLAQIDYKLMRGLSFDHPLTQHLVMLLSDSCPLLHTIRFSAISEVVDLGPLASLQVCGIRLDRYSFPTISRFPRSLLEISVGAHFLADPQADCDPASSGAFCRSLVESCPSLASIEMAFDDWMPLYAADIALLIANLPTLSTFLVFAIQPLFQPFSASDYIVINHARLERLVLFYTHDLRCLTVGHVPSLRELVMSTVPKLCDLVPIHAPLLQGVDVFHLGLAATPRIRDGPFVLPPQITPTQILFLNFQIRELPTLSCFSCLVAVYFGMPVHEKTLSQALEQLPCLEDLRASLAPLFGDFSWLRHARLSSMHLLDDAPEEPVEDANSSQLPLLLTLSPTTVPLLRSARFNAQRQRLFQVVVEDLPYLQELTFSGCSEVPEWKDQYLSIRVSNCRALGSIALSHCRFGTFSLGSLPILSALHFRDCDISQAGATSDFTKSVDVRSLRLVHVFSAHNYTSHRYFEHLLEHLKQISFPYKQLKISASSV